MNDETRQALLKRIAHQERSLAALKADLEKAKAEERKPEVPEWCKPGARVTWGEDALSGNRKGEDGRVLTVLGFYDRHKDMVRIVGKDGRELEGGFHAPYIRPATPAEIAFADFGLSVGDRVRCPECCKEQGHLIERFYEQDGQIMASRIGRHGWPCSKLKKIPKEPVPAPEPAWTLERLKAEFPVGRKVRIVGRNGELFRSDEGYISQTGSIEGYWPPDGVNVVGLFSPSHGHACGQVLHPDDLTLLPEEPEVPEWLTPGAEVLVRARVAGLDVDIPLIEVQTNAGWKQSLFVNPADILPAGIVLGAPGGELENGQWIMVRAKVDDKDCMIGDMIAVRGQYPGDMSFVDRSTVYPIISGGPK